MMTDSTKHSRFNPEHYMHCDGCYEDHLDFEQEQATDAQYEHEENQSKETT